VKLPEGHKNLEKKTPCQGPSQTFPTLSIEKPHGDGGGTGRRMRSADEGKYREDADDFFEVSDAVVFGLVRVPSEAVG
jgi:hypothetical protein